MEKVPIEIGTAILGPILIWVGWLTVMALKSPSRDEVSQKIKTESPYLKDREHIRSELVTLEGHLEAVRKEVQALTVVAERLKTIIDNKPQSPL